MPVPGKGIPFFECSLVGYGEGYATGMIAAKVANFLCKSSLPSGVFHMEKIVDPVTFIDEVEKEGLKFNSRKLEYIQGNDMSKFVTLKGN
jgi:hypothetical protein